MADPGRARRLLPPDGRVFEVISDGDMFSGGTTWYDAETRRPVATTAYSDVQQFCCEQAFSTRSGPVPEDCERTLTHPCG